MQVNVVQVRVLQLNGRSYVTLKIQVGRVITIDCHSFITHVPYIGLCMRPKSK
jgi:hypothetical protein